MLLRRVITTRSANYDTSYLELNKDSIPKYFQSSAKSRFFVVAPPPSLQEFAYYSCWELRGKIASANENDFLQKQVQMAATKSHTYILCWVLEVDESCWVWIIFGGISLCFAPYLCCEQSLAPIRGMTWNGGTLQCRPFPPLLHHWLYNWFFFFFSPVVSAIGAVITIYLGSLFHYSRAPVKPEEKCNVLWFMEAIWPVLIRGIYRTWRRLRK